MTKKSRDFLRRNTKNIRHTSFISAQYLVRLSIQTYVRQSRLGLETCKTPLRQYMVPRAQDHPLLCADGTSLLIDKEAILKRWAKHFDGIYNRPPSINDEAINRLSQVECNPPFDEFPTVSETVKAIKLLSSGKAPG